MSTNKSDDYSDSDEDFIDTPVVQQNVKKKATKNSKNNRDDGHLKKRIPSTSQHKINDLRNKVLEYAQIISNYEKEKKDLLNLLQKHDRIIKKYESQENFLPNIIQRQTTENQALHEQIRIYKERLAKKDKKIKDIDDELEKTQRLLKKLKGLIDDKNLPERDQLNNKLSIVEENLIKKTKSAENLEHYIENLKKVHNHETNIKNHQYYQLNEQLRLTKIELNTVKQNLLEKEKELNIRNIYSNKHRAHRITSSLRTTPSITNNSLLSESDHKFVAKPVTENNENSRNKSINSNNNNKNIAFNGRKPSTENKPLFSNNYENNEPTKHSFTDTPNNLSERDVQKDIIEEKYVGAEELKNAMEEELAEKNASKKAMEEKLAERNALKNAMKEKLAGNDNASRDKDLHQSSSIKDDYFETTAAVNKPEYSENYNDLTTRILLRDSIKEKLNSKYNAPQSTTESTNTLTEINSNKPPLNEPYLFKNIDRIESKIEFSVKPVLSNKLQPRRDNKVMNIPNSIYCDDDIEELM